MYVKSQGETKWIYFLIEDLLNKYNSIWDKTNATVKKKFDNESIYNNLFVKPKYINYKPR